jgi:hypothetical protein
LNWIQISLQIIKRFEKEKDFLIPIWQSAQTQLEVEPGLASFSFFPPIFLFSCSPAKPVQLDFALELAQQSLSGFSNMRSRVVAQRSQQH